MSAWTSGHVYTMWERQENGDWAQKKISILSSQTPDEIIQHAAQFVGALPMQLMRVLPSGPERIAVWMDGVRVNNTDVP